MITGTLLHMELPQTAAQMNGFMIIDGRMGPVVYVFHNKVAARQLLLTNTEDMDYKVLGQEMARIDDSPLPERSSHPTVCMPGQLGIVMAHRLLRAIQMDALATTYHFDMNVDDDMIAAMATVGVHNVKGGRAFFGRVVDGQPFCWVLRSVAQAHALRYAASRWRDKDDEALLRAIKHLPGRSSRRATFFGGEVASLAILELGEKRPTLPKKWKLASTGHLEALLIRGRGDLKSDS